jgi:hypothetical protein
MVLLRRSSGARMREHENIAMRLPGALSSWRKGVVIACWGTFRGCLAAAPRHHQSPARALPKWQCWRLDATHSQSRPGQSRPQRTRGGSV